MKKDFLVFSVLGLLLLGGAGCAGTNSEANTNNKPAGDTSVSSTSSTVKDTTPKTNEKAVDSIKLTGKDIGKQMVQFNWELPEGTTNPEVFRLVRGQKENPTQPPGHWFAQKGTSRGAIWVKLPSGEQHFRICAYENNACGIYSNDVMLDIK